MDNAQELSSVWFRVLELYEVPEGVDKLNGDWKTEDKSFFESTTDSVQDFRALDGILSIKEDDYHSGIYLIDFDNYKSIVDLYREALEDYKVTNSSGRDNYYYLSNFTKEDIINYFKDEKLEVPDDAKIYYRADQLVSSYFKDNINFIGAKYNFFYYDEEDEKVYNLELILNYDDNIDSNLLTFTRDS